nr:HNH endonuclease signature motif containing protein [Blastococcus sp. DSM 46786]
MARLAAALDDLAAERLEGAFGPQLLERLAPLLTAANRLSAEIARTTHQCELAGASEHDGHKTMASWLRGHARFSPAAAFRLVTTGRAIEALPAVAAAAATGAVPAEALAVIAPVTTPANLAAAAAQDVDLAGVDAALAQVAATRPHAELRQVVAHYLGRLDPDGAEPDPTEGRSLSFVKHADGSITFRGELDAVGGEKLQTAVESIVQANRPAGDTRTRAQQQADALVQLADNALAVGGLPILRTQKPHVVVRVDLEDLIDPAAAGPGAAQTGFGTIISAARARWLACDGGVSRIVIGPDGEVLDYGRRQRISPPPLRRALDARDRGCVFTGCDAPAHWCDVHHLVHWIDGGQTDLGNCALLCERHHTKIHHGFRIERQPDGRWRTYRPDGTEILILPRITAEPANSRAG